MLIETLTAELYWLMVDSKLIQTMGGIVLIETLTVELYWLMGR